MINPNRNRSFLLSALLALTAAPACVSDTLTEEERAQLQTMRLPRALPASPTNDHADDSEAARLGQQFFFDRRFSGPLLESSDPASGGLGAAGTRGLVACATCHDPARGGADTRNVGPTSLASAWTTRNSPTVINSAHARWLFWDGRKDTLWSQALGPIENPSEHNTTRVAVARTIFDHYRGPYEKVFGALPALDDEVRFPLDGRPGMPAFDGMSLDDKVAVNRVFANFGKAIEAYERRLVDPTSPFDRYLDGDPTAMSPGAVRGAKLFVGRAACNECHSGPMMSDNRFHNHGVPQIGTKVPTVDRGRIEAVEKVLRDEFNSVGLYSDTTGGGLLTDLIARPADLGAFKTPTLRNVSRTGPYMHTGGFSSLWDVMVWYNEAAGTDGFQGKRAPASEVPLHLSDEDLNDLVEFMRALEGDPLPTDLVTPPALP
jgi:cytochrome c peroxidase